MRALTAARAWWTSPMPLARMAAFRVLVYAFVIFDMLFVANDVVQHGYVPDLYQPTLLARIVHLPTLGVAGGWVLLAVTAAGCLAGIWAAFSGRLQRTAGWVVAVGFWVWMLNSQGFSYVSHDHMALLIAVLVLPSAGRARLRDTGSSEAVGWALRVVQVATVLTYFGSAISKWVRSGTPWAWANGAVFVWAIMRRGTAFIRWTLEYPWLLIIGQWGLILLEFLSPVALFLRGRWLYLLVGVFIVFHTATYLSLGIHFLPTIVCWMAFLPLEQIPQWVRRRRGLTAPAPEAA